MVFHCWNPDDGDESEAGERVDSLSAAKAAEKYARMRDLECGEGFSETQTIMVRCIDGADALQKYTVSAKRVVKYAAQFWEQIEGPLCGAICACDPHGEAPCVLHADHDGSHLDKDRRTWAS